MCLIAHRPLGKHGRGSNISNAVIDHNRRSNPDGFGLAWRSDGRLLHAKFAPSEFEQFRSMLKDLDRDQTIEYAAHWRKATHGAPCRDLSHPFSYEDEEEGEVLVFHNGIIPIGAPQGESDTSHFVRSVLARVEPGWWRNPAMRWLIEESIGYSRLLVMSQTDSVHINPKAWVEEGGLLYSTTPCPTTYKGGGSYGYSTEWKGTSDVPKWVATDDEDDDWTTDYDEDDEEETRSCTPAIPSATKGWYQRVGTGTHYITPLGMEKDGEGDTFGQATCAECKTIGEVYVIGGKVFVDVAHRAPASTTALVAAN